MKTLSLYIILFLLCPIVLLSQEKKPTYQDSLSLYENSILVHDYYENNPLYVKKESRTSVNMFDDLVRARNYFFTMQSYSKTPIKYKDYYQKIDEYKFFQRDIENQTVNLSAPKTLYDLRISPSCINVYVDTSKGKYSGDLMHIPMYYLLDVKPVDLLTDDEFKERFNKEKFTYVKDVFLDSPKKVIIYEKNSVFATYTYGGGALIGFMEGRYFIKIQPSEYKKYAVPRWAQEILERNNELIGILKLKYGGYLLGIK
jgi:hypothetical protein